MSIDAKISSFIKEVGREHSKGYGFTPLIGSGISAPSGVPLIQEISEYLRFCIAIALGLDRHVSVVKYLRGDNQQFKFRKWNPRNDAWPNFSDVSEITTDWQVVLLRTIDKSIRDNPFPRWEIAIYKEAFGAMSEWRTSLQFLARLQHVSDDRDSIAYCPVLLAPQSFVVDSFFRDVIQGKSPTLAHKMIALLSRTMRIKNILTTNFDELLEEAFERIGDPLSVFNVHRNSSIPSYQLTSGSRAIVKLHGGRFGLRADFSLDETPNHADSRNFLSFLIAKTVSGSDWIQGGSTQKHSPVNHLLVMGFSGNDRRIRELIRESCKRIDLSKFKVFWIAFSKRDEDNARNLAKTLAADCGDSRSTTSARIPKWFKIVRHYSPGLLLLELYQHTSLGIPPEGIIVPTTSKLRVPIDPHISGTAIAQKRSQKYQRLLLSLIELSSRDRLPNFEEGKNRRLIVFSSEQDAEGVVSIASNCYRELREKGSRVVWLEMDEIESSVDLFEHVVESVAIQLGSSDWMPLLQSDNDSLRLREIQRLSGHKELVIFLNARGGAGTAMNPGTLPNGWVDKPASPMPAMMPNDASANVDHFASLIEQLSNERSLRITIVLLANAGDALESIRTRLQAKYLSLPRGIADQTIADRLKSIKNWLGCSTRRQTPDPRKLRFLAALCFANRTRYVSSLWTWAYHGGDIDAGMSDKATGHYERLVDTKKWVDYLREIGVLRSKPGGFSWMHVGVRDEIRSFLLESKFLDARLCGEIHHGLAEWSRRLFLASREPLAAFENGFHRLESARWFAVYARESRTEQERKNCITQINANLHEALTILNVARASMLTKGFSSGNRHRLMYLLEKAESLQAELVDAKKIDKTEIQRLIDKFFARVMTILRDCSREVAELDVAFFHHRSLQKLRRAKRSKKHRYLFSVAEYFDHFGNAGTMFIATRSYQDAEEYFCHLFRRYRFPQPKLPKTADDREVTIQNDLVQVRAYLQTVDHWIDNQESLLFVDDASKISKTRKLAISVRIKRGIVNLLRRQMQLLVVRGNLYHLISRRHLNQSKSTRRDSMIAAEQGVDYAMRGRREYAIAAMTYRAATALLRSITTTEEDREEMRRNFDDLQFLETYFGLVLAFLRDFSHAHRRLNDAEACLVDSKVGKESLEMAIVELHRAEVYTQQAVFVPLRSDERMTELGRFRLRVLQLTPRNWTQGLDRVAKRIKFEKLVSSISYIDDGIQTLVRAQRLLNQDRKNVWWTTWYFELKLKLYELKLYACVLDPSIDLPVVGLPYTPRGMRSEIDRLLLDSMRLSRLDIFRQARILDSYSSSMLCVYIRWCLYPSQRPLYAERLDLMRRLCITGRNELSLKTQEKSKKVSDSYMYSDLNEAFGESVQRRSRGRLDKDVALYVDDVIARSQTRLSLTASIDDHDDRT